MTPDEKRLLNKTAARLYPGGRQVLEALEQVNFAVNKGVKSPAVLLALDMLRSAADQMRTAAAGEVDKAAELVLIRYPRTEIRK